MRSEGVKKQGRGGAACMAALLVLWGVTGCDKDEGPKVLSARVERGPLVFTGVYYGELSAAKSVDIYAPSIPNTYQLTVGSVLEDGATVKEGEPLLTFVRDTLEMELRDELELLEVARATRRSVEQQLSKERIDLSLAVQRAELATERARLQVVEGVNLISKLELDKARLDVSTAEVELELAKKAMATFEQKRATTMKIEDIKVETLERKVAVRKDGIELVEVKAPIDGVVYAPYTRLNWQRAKVAPGIVARPGDKILELPDLSKYHVSVYVRQRDAALLKVGDEALITPLIMPEKVITGRVIKREDFATTRNERLGTETAAGSLKEYLVKIELDEAPEALRPGNSARVTVTSRLSEESTLLPTLYASKNAQEESWYATLRDGTERKLKLGRTNLTHVEVIEGLAPGDEVILPAAD